MNENYYKKIYENSLEDDPKSHCTFNLNRMPKLWIEKTESEISHDERCKKMIRELIEMTIIKYQI